MSTSLSFALFGYINTGQISRVSQQSFMKQRWKLEQSLNASRMYLKAHSIYCLSASLVDRSLRAPYLNQIDSNIIVVEIYVIFRGRDLNHDDVMRLEREGKK